MLQDMDMLDHIEWELIVIDECQRPIMWSHINKIRRLDAHMKLLTISDKEVVCFLNHVGLFFPKRLVSYENSSCVVFILNGSKTIEVLLKRETGQMVKQVDIQFKSLVYLILKTIYNVFITN